MAEEQRRVHFEGQVQGVGFRFTVYQIACRFAVSGYVQNLPDGRVLFVAEGEKVEIDAMITAIEERMQPYIDRFQSDVRPASGEFDGFGVR